MMNKVLITGAAGFIGSNVASRYLSQGKGVVGIDNLSRTGTEKNLNWLKNKHKGFKFYKKDVRNFKDVLRIVKIEKPDVLIHLAAQVAVTTSVDNPMQDKEINLDGSVNVLEAVRQVNKNIICLYASTNKVYGGLEQFGVKRYKNRYGFRDAKINKFGISEATQLDFHSPYGCSKGAADQYFHDYSRIYNIPTVVFRQSCIYGPRQFGNEDQGWVIHFVRKALENKTLNIFGDGMQVRDILDVDDLVDLYDLAIKNIKKVSGEVYNVGGGVKNTVSLLELIDVLERKLGKKIKVKFFDWRPGDQRVYISDTRKVNKIGWKPKYNVNTGMERLIEWGREII